MDIGIKGRRELIVDESDSALNLESGTLRVFATPAMVALMEKTCWMSIASYLDDGSCTVGISLNIKHVSATPIGMKVVCNSELVKIDGKRLTFTLKVYDETNIIGEGIHERFIVKEESFQKKANDKLKTNNF
jgi:Predicted thioesterase